MFDDAHYRWKHEPVDGEYELQFDRFEGGEEYHDQIVLLIANEEDKKDLVGQVTLPTDDVSNIEREESPGTTIFHGIIENGELVELTYDSELSEQRHTEMNERYERVRANTDNESDGEQ